MDTQFSYEKLTDMSVELNTQQNRDMVVLRGKALLNERESRLSFVQNAPRGPRSTEVSRTKHSRMVRTPSETYTLTFRFDTDERFILPALIAEVRSQVKRAAEDREKQMEKK